MSYVYPILLDLDGGLVVIVGGGTVAARKARGALSGGATVRVVAPQFCDDMPGSIQFVRESYHVRHLAGAWLVFAATDVPAVNDAVVRDAKAAGIWVNRADAEEAGGGDGEGAGGAGNFVVPAQFKDGGVIVSVSAGSAAVSVAIRDRLAERFDPAWAKLADIVRKLRPMVRESGLAPSRRAAIFRDMAGFLEENVKVEGEKGVKSEEAVREWLRRRLADEAR